MSDFAAHLKLRDPSRSTLVLSPERDAELYVDFGGRVLPALRQILIPSPPVGLVQGEWGMGKSHTLSHAEWLLTNGADEPKWECVRVELSGLARGSTFVQVYGLIMKKLRRIVEEDLKQLTKAELEDALPSNLMADARRAIGLMHEALVASFAPDQRKLGKLRYWIQGEGPTPSQTADLGLGARLKDGASPSELVEILKTASRIHRASVGRGLLVMLDESASLAQSLGQAALLSLAEGLRALVDPDNGDLGVLLAFNKTGSGDSPIVRVDTFQRLKNKTIDLPALNESGEVRAFINDYWQRVSDVQLFEPRALDLFCRKAIPVGATEDQAGRLTPRGLLKLLDAVAQRAVEEQVKLPIPLESVSRWLP